MQYRQQLDQFFNGMPVYGNKSITNQYSQFIGMSSDATGLMTKAAAYQIEEAFDPYDRFQIDQYFPDKAAQRRVSVTRWSFQGKGFLGHNPMQDLSSDVASGNFHQANYMKHNIQVVEFCHREDQDDWPGDLQEKQAVQVGISSGVASLDP